jgi:hypothetical protein
VLDLCAVNNWTIKDSSSKKDKKTDKSIASTTLLCSDISRGREKFEIPVFNEAKTEN